MIPGLSPTQSAEGKRVWVYAKYITGTFKRIHRGTSGLLHLFLLLPFLHLGGHPAINIDVPGRKVWLLGSMFTAADGVLLMLMGLFAAFSLFFFTSVLGRLWCGYTCPQSVFILSWVLPIEQWIEGDRSKRMRFDKQPWSAEKAARKVAKWGLFVGIAFVLSMLFMGFFRDPWLLWSGRGGGVDYSLVAIFTAAWYADFAWFREQLCNYLCPYARFQGALTDDHTLVITYDALRAEPRGGGKRAVKEDHCLDCNWCVDVCPQGIDIRHGFQLECIACAKCIDACTEVTTRAGIAKPFVNYGTIATTNRSEPLRLLRPRTLLYAALLSALVVVTASVVLSRSGFQATVNRSPGSLYQLDADGFVRNTYLLRITNTQSVVGSYQVTVEGLPDVEVDTIPTTLQGAESRTIPLILRIPKTPTMERTYPIQVIISDGSHQVTQPATFKAPGHISMR